MYYCTLTQNETFTLFIMGFTIPEIKTPVSHNAGNEIQPCVGMLKLYQLGRKFIKKNPPKSIQCRIFLI